jgi:hypothetical protein
MYEPIIEELKRRGVDFSMFILRHPDAEYFLRLSTIRKTHPHLEGFREGRFSVRFMNVIAHIPFIGDLFCLWMAYHWSKVFLKSANTKLLVTTDDRALFYPLAVLRAARSLRISSVLYPAETLMFVQSMKEDKSAVMSYPTLLRKCMRAIVAKSYPTSTCTVRGREVHFYSPRQVLPLLAFRSLLPRNPWVRGSHETLAAVAVNSQAQCEENAAHGVARERMVVTGFPSHDQFARLAYSKQRIRSQFEKEFNVSAPRIFLLLGTHFRGVYNPADLPAVQEEVRDVFAILCEKVPKEYLLVVKLHPNTEAKQWIEYFGKTRRPIIFVHREWDAYRLVTIADDMFMFASSVVMAALSTNARVLAYKLRLPSFDEFFKPFRSITRVADIRELHSALAELKKPPGDEMLKYRTEDRERLGMFDGKNAERFCDLVEKTLRVSI